MAKKLDMSAVSLNTTSRKGKSGTRVKSSASMISRYASVVPISENIKFNQFIDALFGSKMTNDDIKQEIKAFVEVLETNYNETISDLKLQIERLQKKLRKAKGDKANTQIEKTEFEALFVECIEDVRKEIMKRRLKNEIAARNRKNLSVDASPVAAVNLTSKKA